MDIKKVKTLLYMAIAELESMEERTPAPVKPAPADKEKRKKEMRLFDAYVKGIIDRETLERELHKLKPEPPTLY